MCITVDDNTTGGPHWGALDNFNFTPDGSPTRMMFCDYFVARTGYDGNHRCYMLNVDPSTGALSYDTTFRDENNGALGVDFNRARLARPQGRRVLQAALDGVRHPRGGCRRLGSSIEYPSRRGG